MLIERLVTFYILKIHLFYIYIIERERETETGGGCIMYVQCRQRPQEDIRSLGTGTGIVDSYLLPDMGAGD